MHMAQICCDSTANDSFSVSMLCHTGQAYFSIVRMTVMWKHRASAWLIPARLMIFRKCILEAVFEQIIATYLFHFKVDEMITPSSFMMISMYFYSLCSSILKCL